MKRTGPKPDPEIDLHLAVACAVNPPGHEWGYLELAEFLGLDHERIRQIEFAALLKLRTRVAKVPGILREVGYTYDQCRPRVNRSE